MICIKLNKHNITKSIYIKDKELVLTLKTKSERLNLLAGLSAYHLVGGSFLTWL